MKKKTGFMVAGGLALAFVYAAGIWGAYNKETIHDIAINAGWMEPPPPPQEPPRHFINAGFETTAGEISFQPHMAVDGCSMDNQVTRLIYETAILADEKRHDILVHPRIAGNIEKYNEQRRSDIVSVVEENWQQEASELSVAPTMTHVEPNSTITGLDFSVDQHGDSLQRWLQDMTTQIYEQHGLKVILRVNVDNGLDVTPARSDILDACSPEGFVPTPKSETDTLPAPEDSPSPF